VAGSSPDPTIYRDSGGDQAATAETSEIDLSGELSGLTSSVQDIADSPTDEEIAAAARDQQASAALGRFEQALQYLEQGLVKEAITELEAAATVPLLRFKAAAQLGRIYIDGGDISTGIEWLERAVEAPAPTPDEGYAVLYALAAALETHGESARALAILMELDVDAGGYRDVRERITQLTRAQTGSHRG
jgi:tetratricopeptide (TPR) repeat protein